MKKICLVDYNVETDILFITFHQREADADPVKDGFTRWMIQRRDDLSDVGRMALDKWISRMTKSDPATMSRDEIEETLWAVLEGNDAPRKSLPISKEPNIQAPAKEAMVPGAKETDMETTSETTTVTTPGKGNKGKVAAKAKGKVAAKAKGKVAAKAKGKKAAAGPKEPRGDKVLAIGRLLGRKSGCTRKDILEVTGWKAVSVQAQAKALGMKLRQEKDPGKPTRYFGTP